MIKIGLTGSIAMGKSTTAAMFRDAGVPVHDSDAAVHALYAEGGAALGPIERLAPGSTTSAGVDRTVLKERIASDPSLLQKIEAIVHPLVAADKDRFLTQAEENGVDIVVFDVPLLFETGADRHVDVVVVVTASADTQRCRALKRPGMTIEHFERLLEKQTPDAEKRRRADFVIDTEDGLEAARAAVDNVLATLRKKTGAPIER